MAGPRSPTEGPRPLARLTLHDYGLIGNLHTAALVSRSGSVDWAMFPRFASPATFAALLDSERGGRFSVRPRGGLRSAQGYLPSTNILRTRFSLPGRRTLDLTDFMPVGTPDRAEGHPGIIRLLQARGGSVPVSLECSPRFDYGRRAARWSRHDGHWTANGGAEAVDLRLPFEARAEDGLLRARGVVRPSETLSVELDWHPAHQAPPGRADPRRLFRTTREFWTGWVHPPEVAFHQVAGRCHRVVERAELTLKLLSHADTGAFVAAPTTSLPEWPGGPRNWDYRYVWIRDAAFSAQALLLLGHTRGAQRFLGWVVDRLREDGPEGRLGVVYGAHGEKDLHERTVPHLRGYLDSRPIRVGNRAADQFQLDGYGELLEAAFLLAGLAPGAVAERWGVLAELAEQVAGLWRRPDHGIWEVRGPPQQFVHSKVMAWVALDRAARLASRFGDSERSHRYREAATEVRAEVLERGFDERHGGFARAFGDPRPDASTLRIPLVGFLPPTDPRVVGTVQWVDSELARGPFVWRYHADDGLRGPEGAFLPASFWRVECLARMGRARDAQAAWEALVKAGGPLMLFPEEYDPERGLPLGNYPQAFSHIAALRAAFAIGLAKGPGRAAAVGPWLGDYLGMTAAVGEPLIRSPSGASG